MVTQVFTESLRCLLGSTVNASLMLQPRDIPDKDEVGVEYIDTVVGSLSIVLRTGCGPDCDTGTHVAETM